MVKQSSTLRRVGLIIFIVFTILGVFLALARAIPDMEASVYGFVAYGYPRLTSLQCPVLMTTADHEAVTIRLHNSSIRSVNWYLRSQITSPVVIVSASQQLAVLGNETKVVSWPVGKENITWGSFILAHIYASSAGPQGQREAYCGTYVLNLPVKGGPVIFYSAIFLTVIGLGLGLWLYRRQTDMSEPAEVSSFRWMRFVAIVVGIGIVAGVFNAWFFVILIVCVTILAIAVILIPSKV